MDGDLLTAIAGQVRMASSASAFALWCSGGDKVITWGNLMCGILDRLSTQPLGLKIQPVELSLKVV